jgi:hypothetical protein
LKEIHDVTKDVSDITKNVSDTIKNVTELGKQIGAAVDFIETVSGAVTSGTGVVELMKSENAGEIAAAAGIAVESVAATACVLIVVGATVTT